MQNHTTNAIEEVKSKGAAQRVRAMLELIRKDDAKVGAFIEVYEKEALSQAERIDAKLKAGKKLGVLGGLVVSVKNSIAVKGKLLTAGSKMLENYVAPYDAAAIEKVIAQDGIIIGSTNLDEFCCGSDCTKSALRLTRNPIDLERVPGGSSGGSAAAVAAGFCDVSLSEDTGGSIRCPAAFCGCAGVKPTYGLVSRYGVGDMAMSFDQLGPISRDAHGSALLMQAVGGEDARDAMTIGLKRTLLAAGTLPKKLRVGVPKEFFEGCEEGVEKLVWKKIKDFESAHDGVELSEFSFPFLKYALPVYYLLVFSEFSSAMQKYDGLKYGKRWQEAGGLAEAVTQVRSDALGAEVKRRILLGTYITTKEFRDAWYTKALRARDALKKEFAKAFAKHDLLAGPTMPTVAWKIGEKQQDPLQMYLADILTVPANCAGIPAATINAGTHPTEKMPVGLQLAGAWENDALVLSAARAAELI